MMAILLPSLAKSRQVARDTVGKANLDCFGQISGDPNVLYVRNEKLRVEYEVTRDERMYKEVVTGL